MKLTGGAVMAVASILAVGYAVYSVRKKINGVKDSVSESFHSVVDPVWNVLTVSPKLTASAPYNPERKYSTFTGMYSGMGLGAGGINFGFDFQNNGVNPTLQNTELSALNYNPEQLCVILGDFPAHSYAFGPAV